MTVRCEAINAMLLNEFLKEHRTVTQQQTKVAEQQSTIAELKTTVAQQQKQIEALIAGLQKVNEQLEATKLHRKWSSVISKLPEAADGAAAERLIRVEFHDYSLPVLTTVWIAVGAEPIEYYSRRNRRPQRYPGGSGKRHSDQGVSGGQPSVSRRRNRWPNSLELRLVGGKQQNLWP
jgi:uncharacterized coiled-coil protein SlyX